MAKPASFNRKRGTECPNELLSMCSRSKNVLELTVLRHIRGLVRAPNGASLPCEGDYRVGAICIPMSLCHLIFRPSTIIRPQVVG